MGRNVPDNEVVKKKIETVTANILVELSSSDIRHWLVNSQDYPYIISLMVTGELRLLRLTSGMVDARATHKLRGLGRSLPAHDGSSVE